MSRPVPYPPVLVATVILLAATFVIVGLVLYQAGALMIVPTTTPVPVIIVDPSIYLPVFISP